MPLWFAFKTCASRMQTSLLDLLRRSQGYLIYVSLIFCYIDGYAVARKETVVICFQILYLWYSVTSPRACLLMTCALWFAFKFCIFDILLHHHGMSAEVSVGCDLLSNFVSLIFCYIIVPCTHTSVPVVICFQILYLWYSVTS